MSSDKVNVLLTTTGIQSSKIVQINLIRGIYWIFCILSDCNCTLDNNRNLHLLQGNHQGRKLKGCQEWKPLPLAMKSLDQGFPSFSLLLSLFHCHCHCHCHFIVTVSKLLISKLSLPK